MTNTQSLSDFNSMWQWTKSRSNYHFNKWQIDNPDNFDPQELKAFSFDKDLKRSFFL